MAIGEHIVLIDRTRLIAPAFFKIKNQNSKIKMTIQNSKNSFFLLILVPLILLISTDTYAAKGIAKKIEEKIGLDENATLQKRVDVVGQKLSKVCDRKDIIYTFKVLKGEEINAFALPDGYIYTYRGLMDKVKSDDEIAAVLAHEMGHLAARHHAKRARRAIITDIFRIVAITEAETTANKININSAINELTLSYSRDEEIEADRLAAVYLKRAGYDPYAVISMINVLIKTELQGPIKPKRRWRTHPYLSDRIRAAREEIQGNIDFMDYANTPTQGAER